MTVTMLSRPADTPPAVLTLLADETLRYAQVWEDSALLSAAFGRRARGSVLSICSAGCNVLALALGGARRVVAVDVNPVQGALLELKIAAIRRLAHPDLAAFVGVRPHADRLALYERVRPLLPAWAAAIWDDRAECIQAGVIGSGRLEQYFRGFQDEVLNSLVASERLAHLLSLDDAAEQRRSFDAIATPAFREAFVAYFGRRSMSDRGRDPAQFRWVRVREPGEFFFRRFRWACTAIPTRGNHYLEYFLTSAYRSLDAAPLWLRPALHAPLRAAVGRIGFELGAIADVAKGSPRTFDAANLSDLFEYLSPSETGDAMAEIAATIRPGGRVAFWNLLVPRRIAGGPAGLRELEPLGRTLAGRDRSWFYRAFRVNEVIPA